MVSYTVEIRQTNPVSDRRWKKTERMVLAELVVYWHRAYLSGHFEHRARWLYGYALRNIQYEAAKKAGKLGPVKKGGNAPLVLKGKMESAMESRIYVRSFPTRAWGRMIAPSYVRMKPSRMGQPPLGREATTIIDSEKKDMAIFAETRVIHHLLKRKAPPIVRRFVA